MVWAKFPPYLTRNAFLFLMIASIGNIIDMGISLRFLVFGNANVVEGNAFMNYVMPWTTSFVNKEIYAVTFSIIAFQALAFALYYFTNLITIIPMIALDIMKIEVVVHNALLVNAPMWIVILGSGIIAVTILENNKVTQYLNKVLET